MTSILDYLSARAGTKPEDIRAQVSARAASAFSLLETVPVGAEFRRIAALPTADYPADLVQRLTYGFRTPWGTRVLRELQAQALWAMAECRGGFFPIEAGYGKTDITYLAPTVFGAKRPILFMPKKLIKETVKIKFPYLHTQWIGPEPEGYRIESYEWLTSPGQGVQFSLPEGWQYDATDRAYMVRGAERRPAKPEIVSDAFLEVYQPDLAIFDECHKLKDMSRIGWSRFARWRAAHPDVPCIFLTATPGDLSEYAHLVEAALRHGAPVPRSDHYRERQAWIGALDHRVESRYLPGPLLQWGTPEEQACPDPLRGGRLSFQRRFTTTPGIVASLDTQLDVPLSIEPLDPGRGCPKIEEGFRLLRTMRITPSNDPVDDDPVGTGAEAYAHALQMGCSGLSYTWDPPAPSEWRETRRETFAWARTAVRRNNLKVDSWALLKQAVAGGLLSDGGLIAKWESIAPTFVPNPVPIWISDECVTAAATWIANHPHGVVWVEHTFFGYRLAEVAGVPYFGAEGIDAKSGRFILEHTGPCIASVAANGEGRNMQDPRNAWHEMLFMSFPQNAKRAEQTIARIHRTGQLAPRVRVYAWVGCAETIGSYWECRANSEATVARNGGAARVLYAESNMPTSEQVAARGGYRWRP